MNDKFSWTQPLSKQLTSEDHPGPGFLLEEPLTSGRKIQRILHGGGLPQNTKPALQFGDS